MKGGTEKHNPSYIAPVVLKQNQREQYSPLGTPPPPPPSLSLSTGVAAKSLVVPLYIQKVDEKEPNTFLIFLSLSLSLNATRLVLFLFFFLGMFGTPTQYLSIYILRMSITTG